MYEEVYVSNLREPVIKGYLKDTKANKRRWCVLQGNRLHIFKTQEDPAMMIINLLGCDIAVDDKKKISYSFRLMPKEGPGISLAIEDGQDLSPWMSAIMAAVVRRGSVDRPNSPLEGAHTIEQARAERIHGTEVDGGMEKEDEDVENFYELPVDNIEVSLQKRYVAYSQIFREPNILVFYNVRNLFQNLKMCMLKMYFNYCLFY